MRSSLPALALCLSPLARAAEAPPQPARWFYPAEGPATLTIEADGTVGGVPAQTNGWVLVKLEPGAAPPLATHPGVAELVVEPGDGRVLALRAEGVDEALLSRQLRALPGVRWAHPDFVFTLQPHALPDDPYAADQWHLENTGQRGWAVDADIDAERAWALAAGTGMVAVIDGGIDLLHADLDVVPGRDYVDGDDDPMAPDDEPHGTASAGLAVAIGGNGVGITGVAQGAQVYAIRLLGGSTSLRDVRQAFIEGVDAGAEVLSNSWGFANGCDSYETYSAIDDAIEYAEAEGRGGLGTVVVVSAGNGDCDNSGDGLLAQPRVVGVAASDGDDRREGYSSYGTGVDITAPSGGVLSTDLTGGPGYGSWAGDGDYADFSGTSASAPIVAGALLVMFEANPALTAAEARDALCLSADKIDLADGDYDETGWSPRYGCGRLNVGAAVAMVHNRAPGAPTLTGPGEAPYDDRVVLEWAPPADPDGDRLRCSVSIWADEADPSDRIDVEGDRVVLTGSLAPGDARTWTARCSDGWVEGPEAEPQRFTVQAAVSGAPPDEPSDSGAGAGGAEAPAQPDDEKGGCGGSAAAGLLIVGLLSPLGRRRRR